MPATRAAYRGHGPLLQHIIWNVIATTTITNLLNAGVGFAFGLEVWVDRRLPHDADREIGVPGGGETWVV
jgi:hypothetical protein